MAKPYRIEAAYARSVEAGSVPEQAEVTPLKRAALPSGAGLSAGVATASPARPVHDELQPGLSEIVAAIRELRAFLDPSYHQAQQIVEAYRRELAELYGLRSELESMKGAIECTKTEVATLRATEQTGQGLRRASGELDAVVADTETATTRILATTEDIESKAGFLRHAGLDPALIGIADSILTDVATLYEACNFQDLTGQRISKIVRTLGFVEERIDGMISAWGWLDAFEAIVSAQTRAARPSNDDDPVTLLNGPRLASDDGHVSQDDIDALFD